MYRGGEVPVVTAQMQADLRADVAYWNAAALVLPDDSPHAEELAGLLDQLAGPSWHVRDVRVWDVRS